MFGKKKKKEAAAEAEADSAETPAEGDAAEGEEGGKKKGKGLILIIAGVAVVLLGGGGAGAFFLLGGKKDAHAAEAGHGEKDAHGAKKGGHDKPKKKKEEKGGHGGGDKPAAGAPVIKEGPDGEVFYTLPDIVVNVQSPEGRSTFLKLKLTLELPDHEAAEHLEPNTPRLNDMFTTFLRELRPEDLSGSQGTYQLRAEILRRVNLVAAPVEVKAVLIEEMLIQG